MDDSSVSLFKLRNPSKNSPDSCYGDPLKSNGWSAPPYFQVSHVTVFDAAQYLLQKLGKMTTMKLHKLLYYAQAWSLVWDETPLFGEKIEAWANGPVIPVLYANHRGMYEIQAISKGDPNKLSDAQKETLDVIIKDYGPMHSQHLSDLTHMEKPWRDARQGIPSGERGNVVIPPEALLEYYGSLPRSDD